MVVELVKEGIDARYFIGGSGVEEEKLQALVKELDAEKYIYFLGNISNEEKYKLLEISDFFFYSQTTVRGITILRASGVSVASKLPFLEM